MKTLITASRGQSWASIIFWNIHECLWRAQRRSSKIEMCGAALLRNMTHSSLHFIVPWVHVSLCRSEFYDIKTFIFGLPLCFPPEGLMHVTFTPFIYRLNTNSWSVCMSKIAFAFVPKACFQNNTYIKTNVGSLYKTRSPVPWLIFCTFPVPCIREWSVLSINSCEVRWPILCLGQIFCSWWLFLTLPQCLVISRHFHGSGMKNTFQVKEENTYFLLEGLNIQFLL